MKDHNLDNIDKLAKKAFEDFEVPYEPMDWVAFQHQLKAEGSIDQVAKEKLEDYQVELPADGWEQFEALLHQKNQNARYIWWCKAAEMGALALLLLGLSQWLPCSDHSSTLAYDANSTPALVATSTTPATSSSETATGQAASDQAPDAYTASMVPSSSAPPSTPLTGSEASTAEYAATEADEPVPPLPKPLQVAENTRRGVSTRKSEPYAASNTTNSAGVDAEDAPATAWMEERHNALPLSNDNSRGATADESNNSAGSNNTAGASTSNDNTAVNKDALILLAPAAWSEALSSTDPVIEIKKATVKAPFQPQHYIGARLGVGANSATTMGRANIGYSAGFTYEREFSSRWSFKMGLVGNIKRYDRNELFSVEDTEGRNYAVSQSKTTHLVLMEVPIDAQYTVFRSDKWRLYLAAGISLNAVGSRSYAGTQEVEDGPLSFSLDLNSADFERGLFEGGDFLNNAYLSAGAGFGVERQLGNQLSLYLLPTYRHAITAAGQDYIHAFDVHIGIKSPIAISKR